MTTAVIIPWRAGDPHREVALEWVLARYRKHHPTWPVFLGLSSDGPFNRAEAIRDGVSQSDADMFVIADGDVWTTIHAAIHAVEQHRAAWAIPHKLVHRLSSGATQSVLDGETWRGLPLSDDNEQDRTPYVGHETGTLLVISREAFDTAPPDARFVGWGQEDDAWAVALRTLVGPPWRGNSDLVHLWHPAQPRISRTVGTEANAALFARYWQAFTDAPAMQALIDESR